MKKRRMIKISILACLLCIVVSYMTMPCSGWGEWKAKAATSVTRPNTTIKQRTATTVTLSMSKVSGVKGYEIYRSTSKNGMYTKLANVTTNTYKDTDCKSSSSYYYKVKAYKTVNGKKVYSTYSNVTSVSATLKKTNNVKVTNQTSGRKVSWNKVSNASKYNVYRSNSKNGDYEYIGSSTTLSYTDKTAKQYQTYYYRVRAYKKSSNIKYYGVYSDKIKSNKINSITGDNVETDNNNSSSTTSSNAAYTKEVLRLVNIERAKEGLSALTTNTTLEKAAYIRSQEIKKSFSHTRPNGSSFSTILKEMNISYQATGENIAYGQKTPEAVVDAWMNSSGHRANIMSSKYNKLGVGCYIDSNNVVYWTQIFTN
ncbi:CAP domain-containing protein [Anaerosporobacter sp.]